MWNDRKRKKYYIALQHELTQKRVDTMLLKEEEVSESNKEHIDKKRSELTEQQIQLCISVLKTTDCYEQLEILEKEHNKIQHHQLKPDNVLSDLPSHQRMH